MCIINNIIIIGIVIYFDKKKILFLFKFIEHNQLSYDKLNYLYTFYQIIVSSY